MNLLSVAWRNLMRRKLRTVLTMLSIIIGVASTFAVVASVDTAKKTFPLYLENILGKSDFMILGTEAYFSEDVHDTVQAMDGVASVAVLKESTKLVMEAEGTTEIQKRVDLTGYSDLDTALTDFKVVEGSLTEGGAVITDRTANVWKTKVGDTISLETDHGIQEIQISAIVKYTVELMGPSSWMMAKYHPWSVVVPLSDLQSWFDLSGQIQVIQVKALNGSEKEAAQRQLDALADTQDNIYMQPVIIDFETQFKDVDTFFMALYIAGFLGIALSAFVIFNSLYVSIQERKKEFAAMKTIGYTPNQLRTFVLYEVLLLSVIGTVVGLTVGYGLALLLKAVIFMLFGIHEAATIELTKGLVIAAAAGAIIPVLAALYPIRKAGKVSVIDSLKEIQTEKTSLRHWQWAAGVLLILSGFFIKNLFLVVPLLIGVALLYPYLFRLFVTALKPVYRALFRFSGEVAGRNLSRNLGRTSMTSVILCMGIAMIVLMSSLNSALIQTYERMIFSTYGGNLDVMLHHVEPDDIAKLKATEGVADAVTYPKQDIVWLVDGQKRKLPVYGVGAEWIDRFPLFTGTTGASQGEIIEQLAPNEIVLDRVSFQLWGGTVGEYIQLDTLNGMQPFKVAGIVDTMKNNGFGAFMNIEHFRESFGVKYERNALVLKEEDISPLQLRENIFGQFGSRIMEMFGPEDWVSVIGSVYTGSFGVINFLIILSTVISGIGITNTLLMNIMERIRELGMMRAVGVTRGQIVRTVLLEGFGIGLTATVIGSLFGILLIYITSTFLEIQSLTFQFGVSGTIMTIIVIFGLAVSLISSFLPASRAAKTQLSEALRYE